MLTISIMLFFIIAESHSCLLVIFLRLVLLKISFHMTHVQFTCISFVIMVNIHSKEYYQYTVAIIIIPFVSFVQTSENLITHDEITFLTLINCYVSDFLQRHGPHLPVIRWHTFHLAPDLEIALGLDLGNSKPN